MGPDTHFAFTAQLSQAQLTATVRRAGQQAIWFSRVLGLLTSLYGLLKMILAPSGVAMAVLLVAFGAVLAVGFPVLLVRKSLQRVRKTFNGPITYRIDAEGVRSSTQLTDGVVRWPLIERFDTQPDLLLLWLSKVQVIPVAVGQLPPDTRAALVAFVRSHVSGAGPAPLVGEQPSIRPPMP